MNHKIKSDPNLNRLKVALATGGLVATMIGTGLLGERASALAAEVPSVTISEPADTSADTTTIDSAVPAELDLKLEAIPTVAAPTFRSMPLTFGRSSR